MAKILVVNNDIDTMSLLKKWLQRKNYEVKYTSNGEEAPHIAKEFSPDLVLVDVLQSKVADELKSDNNLKKIPVILMTGYTIGEHTISIINADDAIAKPFNLDLLQKKIEKFLKKTG
ncbi:MAG: response regulator [Ginsengibacter sp.]